MEKEISSREQDRPYGRLSALVQSRMQSFQQLWQWPQNDRQQKETWYVHIFPSNYRPRLNRQNAEVWMWAHTFPPTSSLKSSHDCGEIHDSVLFCFFSVPLLIQHDRPMTRANPESLSGSVESARVSANAVNDGAGSQFYPGLCRSSWFILI